MAEVLERVTIWGPKGEPLWAEWRVIPDPAYRRNRVGFQAPSARETSLVREPLPEAPRGAEGPAGAGEPMEGPEAEGPRFIAS